MRNAFYQMLAIRANIGERFGTEVHWHDDEILQHMNMAQDEIAGILQDVDDDWFLKSTTLTPSASKISLPSDCDKVAYIEEASTGAPIDIDITVRERRVHRTIGSTLDVGALEAYVEDDYVVVNQDNYANNVTFWYYKRIPDLAFGVIATGAASSLTMEATQFPSYENDYYNGVTVETMDATNKNINLRSTVSDYVASTRVMTVTGTPNTNDYYGTVSMLPRKADRLIVLKSSLTLMARPSSAIDPQYFEKWIAIEKKAEDSFRKWARQRVAAAQHVKDTGGE